MEKFIIGKNANRFLLFRIVLGVLMLFKISSLGPHWLDFYGDNGFFPREIMDLSNHGLLPYFGITDSFSWFFNISTNQASLILFWVMIFASVSLIFGLFSRLSTLVLLLLNVSLTSTFFDYVYGVDFFLSSLLFYALLAPLGYQFSLDKILANRWQSLKKLNGWNLKPSEMQLLMGGHLCIVYLTGGLTKAFGPTWWNGTAIWTALHRPDLEWTMFMIEYLDYKFIYVALGAGTIIVELLYPVMIWFKKTRTVWLLLTLGMHLFIGIVMELHLFASVMILFNLISFGGELDFYRFSSKKEDEATVLA